MVSGLGLLCEVEVADNFIHGVLLSTYLNEVPQSRYLGMLNDEGRHEDLN